MPDGLEPRELFAERLLDRARRDDRLVALDADLHHHTRSSVIAQHLPKAFLNVGIAEQNMVSFAAGLSAVGMLPVVFSFAAFLTGRAWEQLRDSVCHTGLSVAVVGTHYGFTSCDDGPTHQTFEDVALMSVLPLMEVWEPIDVDDIDLLVRTIDVGRAPHYIRLSREKIVTYDSSWRVVEEGLRLFRSPGRLMVVTTGIHARYVASILRRRPDMGDVGLCCITRLKPLPLGGLREVCTGASHIVIISEQQVSSGTGPAVALALQGRVAVSILGMNGGFGEVGPQDAVRRKYGLSEDCVEQWIAEKLHSNWNENSFA